MKKFFTIIILLLILSGCIYWIYTSDQAKQLLKTSSESNTLNESKILELLNHDDTKEKDRVLQTAAKSPDQVVALNSLLIKVTYSRELSKDELKKIVDIQRYQFAKELLSQNNKVNQQLRVWVELKKQKDKKIKVIGFKALAPYPMDKVKYDGIERSTVKVSVVYYTNISGKNQYVDYLLYENDDHQWKIVGWTKGDEFLVTD